MFKGPVNHSFLLKACSWKLQRQLSFHCFSHRCVFFPDIDPQFQAPKQKKEEGMRRGEMQAVKQQALAINAGHLSVES